MKKILKNKFGFSMVEVMIATGISAGIGLMVANILTNSQNQKKKIEVKSDLNVIHGEIKALLANQTSCTTAIQFALEGTTDPNTVNASNNLPSPPRQAVNLEALSLGTVQEQPVAIFACDNLREKSTIQRNGDIILNEYCANPKVKYQEGQDYYNRTILIQRLRLQSYKEANGVTGNRIYIRYILRGSKDDPEVTDDPIGNNSRRKITVAGVGVFDKYIELQVRNTAASMRLNPNADGTPRPPMATCSYQSEDVVAEATQAGCNGSFSHWDPKTQRCYHEVDMRRCPDGQSPKLSWKTMNSGTDYNNSFNADSSGSIVRSNRTENTRVLSIECVNKVSSCAPTQVMTSYKYRSNQFVATCKTVPTCNNNQYIAFNGSYFLCRQKRPLCPAGHMVWVGNNKSIQCIRCNQDGQFLVMTNSGPVCTKGQCPHFPTQQYLAGFDNQGQPICREILANSNNCKNGSVIELNRFTGKLVPRCCPPCQKHVTDRLPRSAIFQVIVDPRCPSICYGTRGDTSTSGSTGRPNTGGGRPNTGGGRPNTGGGRPNR